MPVLTFLFADLTVGGAACLAVSAWGAGSALVYLTYDADPADFDPRRLLDTDRGARLVVGVFNARHAFREFVRDAAALVLLLTTSPKGALR